MFFFKPHIITFVCILLISNFLNGQSVNGLTYTIDSLYNLEKYQDIVSLNKSISRLNKSKEKAHLLNKLGLSYKNLNKEDSAFHYYKKALDIYQYFDLDEKIALTNYYIYYVLSSQNNSSVESKSYLKVLTDYANQSNSDKWKAIVNHQLGIKYFNMNTRDSCKYYLNKSLDQFIKIDSTKMISQLYSDVGYMHSYLYQNQESARMNYQKALELHQNDSTENRDLNAKFYLFLNIGNSYKSSGEYAKALEHYKYIEPIELPKLNTKSKKILYGNMEATYFYMNDFENAYKYIYKYDSIEKIIDLAKQNTSISEIEEKYNNEKLRTEALTIESKRKKNRNLLVASLAFMLFGGITAFLINKNLKRKQLLAEQDKELQTQKVATLLKEQELLAIDAMIEGQEKERQLIADDLHDDLGGLMATIKLHFDALQKKQSPKMFTKTNNLIEEAYQKIRGIAHAKNSGLLASQGLLKAIKQMAKKTSDSNKLKIEVIDYGLENRLENSMELSIFRIIQELVTNTIKHANASEVTIQITNHDHKLNIVVEDNGDGFDLQILSNSSGMGIISIEKRIENLNGNVHIDSKIGQGTSVIIDIPT